MKKITCLVLALLMLLAMFATAGMTADPASVSEEPAPVSEEPAGQPEVPASDPVQPQIAAPEATETEAGAPAASDPVGEPAPVEPAPEAGAQTEEVEETEKAEDVEKAEEPAPSVDEPVAGEPAADNGVAPASEPAAAPISGPAEEEGPRTVAVYANGGCFPAPRSAYDPLTVTLTEEGKLPKADTEAEKDWYIPQRAGYRFVGWYKDNPGPTTPSEDALDLSKPLDKEVTALYAGWVRVLVLDAAPGSFNDKNTDNYSRTVDVPNGVMPNVEAYKPVFNTDAEEQSADFIGWYTAPTSVTHTEHEGYWTWDVKTNGQEVKPGDPLAEGVTTLYAGYKVNEAKAPETARQAITFYLDWNGINGMWGKCLTLSRSYDAAKGGYTLTPADLLVWSLNWDSNDEVDVSSMDALNTYWAGRTFPAENGYTFRGWATTENATDPDVDDETVVKDGDSIYAVWTKDGDSSQKFVADGGRDKTVGPLEFIQFPNLKNSAHGKAGATATVTMHTSPVDAELSNVVWNVTYSVPRENPFAPPLSYTVQVKDGETFDGQNPGESKGKIGIEAKASGRTLTFTDVDGMDHVVTVTVSSDTDYTDPVTQEKITSVQSNTYAEVVFTHSWQENKEELPATCSTRGAKYYECSDCDAEKTVETPMLTHVWEYTTTEPKCTEPGYKQDTCKYCGITFAQYQQEMNAKGLKLNPPHKTTIIPATGHEYKTVNANAGRAENGLRLISEQCVRPGCGDTEIVMNGDATGDNNVNVLDVDLLFQIVNKQVVSTQSVEALDLNGDGKVNVLDVDKIFMYVNKQIASFD